MNIEHFMNNLSKRPIEFRVGAPCGREALDAASARLGFPLPEHLCSFFLVVNGLDVTDPALQVLPIEELRRSGNGLIRFATLDHRHHLALDSTRLNEAGQWSVVSEATGYVVTLTIASFWSNKIFAWLDKKRGIWSSERAA